MTPLEIYSRVLEFSGESPTIICNLHSACSPRKVKSFLCHNAGSALPIIDFDEVKVIADKTLGLESRKSVDALTISPSRSFLCFVELKSWELLILHGGSERHIRRQASKYSSDLPLKLSDSIKICEQIADCREAFADCGVVCILLTDISVEGDGIMAFSSDLAALAGISSNLKDLFNSLSQGVMDGITSVETRYWECRSFDKKMSVL